MRRTLLMNKNEKNGALVILSALIQYGLDNLENETFFIGVSRRIKHS